MGTRATETVLTRARAAATLFPRKTRRTATFLRENPCHRDVFRTTFTKIVSLNFSISTDLGWWGLFILGLGHAASGIARIQNPSRSTRHTLDTTRARRV